MNYKGPFYVRNEQNEYELADICKQCAFCSESDGVCYLDPCTYLFSVAEAECENE